MQFINMIVIIQILVWLKTFQNSGIWKLILFFSLLCFCEVFNFVLSLTIFLKVKFTDNIWFKHLIAGDSDNLASIRSISRVRGIASGKTLLKTIKVVLGICLTCLYKIIFIIGLLLESRSNEFTIQPIHTLGFRSTSVLVPVLYTSIFAARISIIRFLLFILIFEFGGRNLDNVIMIMSYYNFLNLFRCLWLIIFWLSLQGLDTHSLTWIARVVLKLV